MHLDMKSEAQEIAEYVIREDSDYNTVLPSIYAEQGKCGGIRYHQYSGSMNHTEIMWAQKYHDSIENSEWFLKRNLSPGEAGSTEVSYNYLYPLYRILDEYHPQSILEWNMGQVTKMTVQYADRYRISHTVMTNDRERAEWYIKKGNISWDCTNLHISPIQNGSANGLNGVIFQDFKEITKDKKYDLLLIKAPSGQVVNTHMDLLTGFIEILAKDFAIFVDHTELNAMAFVLENVVGILQQHGIHCFRKDFSSENRMVSVIASESWKYISEF